MTLKTFILGMLLLTLMGPCEGAEAEGDGRHLLESLFEDKPEWLSSGLDVDQDPHFDDHRDQMALNVEPMIAVPLDKLSSESRWRRRFGEPNEEELSRAYFLKTGIDVD